MYGFFVFLCQISDSFCTPPLRVDFAHRVIVESRLGWPRVDFRTTNWLFLFFSKWLEMLLNRVMLSHLLHITYLIYNKYKRRLVLSFRHQHISPVTVTITEFSLLIWVTYYTIWCLLAFGFILVTFNLWCICACIDFVLFYFQCIFASLSCTLQHLIYRPS